MWITTRKFRVNVGGSGGGQNNQDARYEYDYAPSPAFTSAIPIVDS